MTTAPTFTPLDRRTLAQEVRLQLTHAIRSGTFPPGAQLPSERALSAQFGVALNSVREALQGLITTGVITRHGNRTYVAERLPDIAFAAGGEDAAQHVRELFEVRQAIELPIAELAAERAGDDELRAVSALAQQFTPGLTINDFRRLDRAFHSTLARASGNALLTELYGKVLDRLFTSEHFAAILDAQRNAAAVSRLVVSSGREHRAIAQAVLARDAAKLREAVQHHLRRVETQMLSQLVHEGNASGRD